MPSMKKVDLTEFLTDLTEFLPKAKPDLPETRLSPPELLVLHWRHDTCSCGREFESEEHGPTIRHTFYKRHGFGMREVGKVYIPWIPGFDVSDVPQEIRWTRKRIFACPSCIGKKASLDLFPETKQQPFRVRTNGEAIPEYTARWLDMHNCADQKLVHDAMNQISRNHISMEDLHTFSTKTIDLQSAIQATCDPEPQIEN